MKWKKCGGGAPTWSDSYLPKRRFPSVCMSHKKNCKCTRWGAIVSGSYESYDVVGCLRRFANIRCIEAKRSGAKRIKTYDFKWSSRARLLTFGIKGIKEKGGGAYPVVCGAYYNSYVQESLSFGGGSSCSMFMFGLFPLSGTKLTSLFV